MIGSIAARWQLLPAALVLTVGCLVDTDDPCEENQVEIKGDVAGCLCAPGTVLSADSRDCIPCGANEVVRAGQCECDVGFARTGEGGACVRSELGAACSATMPCAAGSDFPFCAPLGYCTKQGCASSAECTGGYWCDTAASPPFCTRPPSGLGTMCMSSEQCATFEANTCAMGSCVVGGCATGAARCYADTVCCDFRSFGIGDICIPPTSLVGGNCPGTGAAPVVQP